jgi:hypothetical protein
LALPEASTNRLPAREIYVAARRSHELRVLQAPSVRTRRRCRRGSWKTKRGAREATMRHNLRHKHRHSSSQARPCRGSARRRTGVPRPQPGNQGSRSGGLSSLYRILPRQTAPPRMPIPRAG